MLISGHAFLGPLLTKTVSSTQCWLEALLQAAMVLTGQLPRTTLRRLPTAAFSTRCKAAVSQRQNIGFLKASNLNHIGYLALCEIAHPPDVAPHASGVFRSDASPPVQAQLTEYFIGRLEGAEDATSPAAARQLAAGGQRVVVRMEADGMPLSSTTGLQGVKRTRARIWK